MSESQNTGNMTEAEIKRAASPTSYLKELEEVPPTEYEIRKLRDGDTYKVAGMLGKIMGDENVRWAAAQGDDFAVMLGAVAALMEHAEVELRAFLADLIGLADDRQALIKEERQKDADNQEERFNARREQERRLEAHRNEHGNLDDWDELPIQVPNLVGAKELERRVQARIAARLENYPPGTSQNIIAELMGRDDFLPFVSSSRRVYEAGQKLRGKFGTPSS